MNNTIYLQALIEDQKGNWEQAHDLIQDLTSPEAAWIHAFLHRKEGDVSNARYWYHRANKPFPTVSLSEEWETIYQTLDGQ